jgi:hypothetical protein
MYNILLYIIASLLSLYNNINTLYSQLFYHWLVIILYYVYIDELYRFRSYPMIKILDPPLMAPY